MAKWQNTQTENGKTLALNDTLNQMNLKFTEHFVKKTEEYTFFSSAFGTFSRIDRMLGHRSSLNKFKIDTISSTFSNHNGVKLEINYKKKNGKQNTNTWRQNNMLLNNQTIKEKN